MNYSPAAIMAFYILELYKRKSAATDEYWVPLRPGCHLTLVPSEFRCHQILVPSKLSAIPEKDATNARVLHTECRARIGALPATVTW